MSELSDAIVSYGLVCMGFWACAIAIVELKNPLSQLILLGVGMLFIAGGLLVPDGIRRLDKVEKVSE